MSNKNHTEPISRVFDLLPFIRQERSRQVLFGFRRNGRWETTSTSEYIESSNKVSYALLEMGIGKGDNLVTITPNRPEFNFVDMGMLQLGTVHVPLYPGITESKLFEILLDTKCRAVFLANRTIFSKIQALRDRLPYLDQIISFEPIEGAMFFDDFLRLGASHANPLKLEEVKAGVLPADPASIIYISGASTPVKGVVLTHRNHVSNLINYAKSPHISGISSTVSILPLAHSYERMINYCQQYFGFSIWYNDKIPGMLRDFEDARPEMLVMVPLLLQRLFAQLEQQSMNSGFLLGRLAKKSIRIAKKTKPDDRPGIFEGFFLLLARWFLFPKWQQAMGGKLQFILCGGAALDPHLLNLFHSAGIPIYEGYGITEAGPLVSYNMKGGFRKYTVGKIMPGVEVRIAEDGEVLVKSPGIMQGYYRNSVETMKVIDPDGWLHTGDLGTLDIDGFLSLTGIKKDIFKLSSGLYVCPAVIEEKLKASDLIKQVYVYGHNRDYLVAILVPDLDRVSTYFPGMENIGYQEEMLKNEAVLNKLNSVVKAYNSQSRGPDQVMRYEFVADEWSVENGLLDPGNEPDRMRLQQKYGTLIQSLYT